MDRARAKALEVLHRWERKRGSPIDPLFQRLVERDEGLCRRDKAFCRELVYGVLRWLTRIDYIIERHCRKGGRRLDPLIRNIVRLGVYQLLFMDRVPPWAAVYEAVELAKGMGRQEEAGFVNGLLRAIQREETFKYEAPDRTSWIALFWAHPPWMVKMWVERWGVEETEALCRANNTIPPLTVRTNTLKIDREGLLKRLEAEGMEPRPTPYSPWGVILGKPEGLTEGEAFREGLFQVQDEAAQLISWLLGPKPGERVLDLCAAPGGKTTHMAELMGDEGEIVAVDVSPQKLKLLKENCLRLGLRIVRPRRADATAPLPFRPGSFDRVLADVPCTGLGVLRRHPDAKWRLRPEDPKRLSRIQLQILREGARMLKGQGLMLYSTCTLTIEENEGVIEEFLMDGGFELLDPREKFPELEGLFSPEGFLLTLPHRHGTDGFFAALLQKKG